MDGSWAGPLGSCRRRGRTCSSPGREARARGTPENLEIAAASVRLAAPGKRKAAPSSCGPSPRSLLRCGTLSYASPRRDSRAASSRSRGAASTGRLAPGRSPPGRGSRLDDRARAKRPRLREADPDAVAEQTAPRSLDQAVAPRSIVVVLVAAIPPCQGVCSPVPEAARLVEDIEASVGPDIDAIELVLEKAGSRREGLRSLDGLARPRAPQHVTGGSELRRIRGEEEGRGTGPPAYGVNGFQLGTLELGSSLLQPCGPVEGRAQGGVGELQVDTKNAFRFRRQRRRR